MLRYLIRRVATMLSVLIVVVAFVFILGQYGAGDLAMHLTLQMNDNMFDPEIYNSLRQQLHMDEPVLKRFTRFLGDAVRGDFGVSYILPGTPKIGRMMAVSLPISMQLGAAAMVIVAAVGIPLGVLAALSRNSLFDHLIVGLSTVLSSVPAFVLVPVALYLLVIELRILPTVGFGWHGLFSKETLLPAACLAAGPLLGVVRYTRASVVDVLSQEYVRAARAKGLSEWSVIGKHVIKNAMTPVLTVLGLSTARVLSGSIFIEIVFNLRGFGDMAVRAFQGGDIQTTAATTLVSAMIVMVANLVVDFMYGVLDPRVRVGQ
jgi:peptide/nickel transport system permease protein